MEACGRLQSVRWADCVVVDRFLNLRAVMGEGETIELKNA
jgi:hypothetical protein